MKTKQASILLILFALVLMPSCKKKGCMQPLADNYDSEAVESDGSCSYAGGPYSYVASSQYHVEATVIDGSGYSIPNATVSVYWRKDGESTLLITLTTNGVGNISHYGNSQDLFNLGVENNDEFVAGSYSGFGSGSDTTNLVSGGAKIHFDDIIVQ